MSTAQFDTLKNRLGTKSVPVDTVIDGSAKAWVNFNGTGTVAIRAAFNVSSITDNGTGDYTANFVTPMPDANYALVGSLEGAGGALGASTATAAQTTSRRLIAFTTSPIVAADNVAVMVAFFR